MGLYWVRGWEGGMALATVLVIVGIQLLKWVLKRVNCLIYETKLDSQIRCSLPPGDMGWPLIGNMWSFLRAFKSRDPDSFMRSFVTRYGRTGIYKGFMFGRPCVFVTTPETCKRVLTDDYSFTHGWPKSTLELMGKKSFIGDISYEEHKRLRRLTASPINGHEALSVYLEYIEENVTSELEKWATMGPIEFVTQLRKLTYRIIMHIFLGSEVDDAIMDPMEREYTSLNHGVRSMAINLPGFAYHRALKARRKLVAILQSVVTERRCDRRGGSGAKREGMVEALIEVEDQNGRKLTDEEIIDILLMYLNAGHESSAHITTWACIFLQQHPHLLMKAKEEQENIIRRRPPTQKGMSLKEFREMDYLSKVIDETLRLVTFSLMVFREAKSDVKLSGHSIPKGWTILVWFRSVHLDPEVYPDPLQFDPDRWENNAAKAGTFLPFGAGSRMCPGNDLAKLEIAVFLHHFLLNYRLERLNPKSPLVYLPHSRPQDNCLSIIRKISSALLEIVLKLHDPQGLESIGVVQKCSFGSGNLPRTIAIDPDRWEDGGYLINKLWSYSNVHKMQNNIHNISNFLSLDYTGKAGTFLPFGAGSRMCPGNDLC